MVTSSYVRSSGQEDLLFSDLDSTLLTLSGDGTIHASAMTASSALLIVQNHQPCWNFDAGLTYSIDAIF